MIKTFTENDLIRYVYGETSELETKEIETTLLIDPELAEDVRDIKLMTNALDNIQWTPSDGVVDKILKYSVSST